MKTDAKHVLLTTVAALSLTAGGAFAQSAEATTADTDQPEAGVMANAETNTLLNDSYSDIGDTQVAELIGMNVLSDTGEDVGEVDNFVILDDELKAVVGVGGFLGLGEHDVAISLNDMEYTGEALQLSFTREELEQMPEYTEELEQARLAETDTLNTFNGSTGGMMDTSETASMDSGMSNDAETEGTDMAATGGEVSNDMNSEETDVAATENTVETEVEQEATELANDADAAVEETEDMAENAAVETENAVEDAGETMANAAAETENAVEGAADDAGQELADAGDATETALEDAGQDVADAGEATENAIEGAAASAGAALADAGEATENAVEDAGNAVADAGEATENAIEDAGQEIASWDEKLESEFADIANTEIAELEGTTVIGPNGETVGEVDNIGMMGDAMVAIVGVGGFLGLGEHDVAIELADLGWRDGQFVAEGMTKEDLEAMPEYNPDELQELEADATLSTRMN